MNFNKHGVFSRIKTCAERRGIDFQLDEDGVWQLVHGQNCFFCDAPLDALGHGIDRLNSKDTYNETNVVACCSRCNKVKSTLDCVTFYFWMLEVDETHVNDCGCSPCGYLRHHSNEEDIVGYARQVVTVMEDKIEELMDLFQDVPPTQTLFNGLQVIN